MEEHCEVEASLSTLEGYLFPLLLADELATFHFFGLEIKFRNLFENPHDLSIELFIEIRLENILVPVGIAQSGKDLESTKVGCGVLVSTSWIIDEGLDLSVHLLLYLWILGYKILKHSYKVENSSDCDN